MNAASGRQRLTTRPPKVTSIGTSTPATSSSVRPATGLFICRSAATAASATSVAAAAAASHDPANASTCASAVIGATS